MRTIEDLLAEFSRKGWGLSSMGGLRDTAFGGAPRSYYASIYPATFGKEVWWDIDGDRSYGIITPRFSGHGKSPEEAMAKALELASASKEKKLYRRFTKAWKDQVDARESLGEGGRGTDSEASEDPGVEGL